MTRRQLQVAARAGASGRRRTFVIALEPIERAVTTVEDRFGVREPALLARESFRFIGAEPQPFQLVELELQKVESGRSVLSLLGNLGDLAPQIVPLRRRLGHLPEQRVVAAEIVDDDSLTVAVEQQVMHVLAVYVHEVLPQLAQELQRYRTLIDVGARTAPRTHHAPNDALARVLFEIPVGEPGACRFVRGRLEHAAHFGPLGAGANHVGAGTRTEEQRQRIDHDRFARARLPGEGGHPRRTVELQAVDDREGSDRQMREHAGRRLPVRKFHRFTKRGAWRCR